MVPFVGLLVGAVTFGPVVIFTWEKISSLYEPRFDIITFSAENVSNANGNIRNKPNFGISVQVINLSDKKLIIDDSLFCNIRDSVYYKRKENNIEKSDDYKIFKDRGFGFNIYLENTNKMILEPGETKTSTWSTNDSISLEYYGNQNDTLKYDNNNVRDFYIQIISDIKPIVSLWPNINLPRGSGQNKDGELIEFFLNLDCQLEIDQTLNEIHLEFVYENAGRQGNYPRWSVGKNISSGAGNGGGNGT